MTASFVRTARAVLSVLFLGLSLQALAAESSPSIPAAALDRGLPGAASAAWRDAQPVRAAHAMVVSDQHEATAVGLRILREGGNAIDAAVAMGYAQAVVNPCCGNIGGGGFMVVHLADGRNLFLDFREKAPLRATETLFQDAEGRVIPGRSTHSFLAVGVPGTVMGLNAALARFGTMRRAQVMAPAIALARDGFALVPGDVHILRKRAADFAEHPNVAAIFLHDGRPWEAGEVLRQPQLVRTLERIARDGDRAFYRGPIAREIVAASTAGGGILSMRDFRDYTVRWSRPLQCSYRGVTVLTTPPPGSGTTLCEVLAVLEGDPLSSWGYGSVRTTHALAEAERHAFADRNTFLGDPAFVRNPVWRLLSKQHIASIRAAIEPDRATPSSEVRGLLGAAEGQHTTHYSVVDAQGNAVAVTYTINYLFGLGRIAGDTGFFLNNEMDDFTSKPGVPNAFGLVQGRANAIAPGKRPLSSMTPTIVLRDGRPFLVTGSPGGSTIISTTLESILNVVDFGMNVQQAVDAPRVHMQWYPDEVFVEPGYLTPQSRERLQTMGYRFKTVPSWGADEAIHVEPATGVLSGANDRRRPAGLAAGD